MPHGAAKKIKNSIKEQAQWKGNDVKLPVKNFITTYWPNFEVPSHFLAAVDYHLESY